ncbi:MAG: hexitol phosphatase HxpB [Leadbetterella sp.]|nr:hexitol phosphatase HxpB [Leadbetterella sp.]
MISYDKFQGVIYDMDGLLVNSEPIWQEAEKEVFKTVGITLTTEDCLKTTGIPTTAVFDYWYEISPWEGKSKQELEKMLFEKVFSMIKENASAMPGVKETLIFFKNKGLKIGLASASPLELIQIVLERLEIREYFDFYHSATLEKNNKPHPDVYLTVAKKLGCPIENCLILEDSINGVRGAKASGATVVAVPDDHFYDFEEYTIADFKIKNLLELVSLPL